MRFLLIIALAGFVAACGSRPFTGQLAELDALLQARAAEDMRVDTESIEDPNVRALRVRAIEALDASEVNFNFAADAWGSRKEDLTQEFSRVGLIYYHAADNFSRTADGRLRLLEANRSAQEQRERRNIYDDMFRSESELVALLETITALFEDNEALRREIATMESQYQTESRAGYAIQEARVLQREAEGRKADEFATSEYTTANASLARAQQHFDEGDFERAYDVALRSMEEYRLAISGSEHQFMAEQDRMLSNSQNQAIFEEAQRVFGADLAFIDARGMIIVIPALFNRGDTNMRSERVYLLDEVLTILRQYEGRDILIEGHTQDRGSDETNMALSQTRANEVQDWFVQRSIRSSRVSTAGFGEGSPRFDNRSDAGRSDNDRVEIVFTVR